MLLIRHRVQCPSLVFPLQLNYEGGFPVGPPTSQLEQSVGCTYHAAAGGERAEVGQLPPGRPLA